MAEAAAEDEAGEGESDDSWVEPDYGSHGSAFDSSDADDSASLQSMDLHDFDPVGGPSSRPPSTRPRTPLPLLALASAQRGPPKPWKDPRFYFDKDPIDYSKVYGWRSLLKMPSIPRYLDICDNERAGVFLPDNRVSHPRIQFRRRLSCFSSVSDARLSLARRGTSTRRIVCER